MEEVGLTAERVRVFRLEGGGGQRNAGRSERDREKRMYIQPCIEYN